MTNAVRKYYSPIYHMYSDRQAWVNSVEPDELQQTAVSHQGLHCLSLIQQFLDTTLGNKLFMFKLARKLRVSTCDEKFVNSDTNPIHCWENWWWKSYILRRKLVVTLAYCLRNWYDMYWNLMVSSLTYWQENKWWDLVVRSLIFILARKLKVSSWEKFYINWQEICVELLRPSQPNGVMSSAVSLPNHTFTGQA